MPPRARIALLGAAGALVALLVVWFAAFHVGVVERADQSVLRGFVSLSVRPHVSSLASKIAHLCDPKPFTLLGLVPIIVAVRRRRPWLAVGLGAVLLGANVTTQLLKPLLATPRLVAVRGSDSPILPASWPSGHATAAMSLALAYALAVPARLRPRVAAAGAVFAIAVCYSFLTLEWHYPSDVLGGFLIAFIWTLLAVAGVVVVEQGGRRAARERPAPDSALGATLLPSLTALGAAAALCGLVLLARPHEVVTYAADHRLFVVGAALIALLALALVAGVALIARR